MTFRTRQRRSAVTLLEVLLAMSLLGTLFGLFLVWLQQARERANVASCQAHLKDLALAVHNYETVNRTMPPYASGRRSEIYGSWYMHLLPYVGHQDLYELLHKNQRIKMPNGAEIVVTGQFIPEVRRAVFPELVCASDPTRHALQGNNHTNYLANWYALGDGVHGTYRRAQRLDSLTDGLSNVVLLAEAYSECHGLPRLALYSSHFHNFGITQEGLPSDDSFYAPKDYLMFQDNPRPQHCDKWRTQTPHTFMPTALADGSVRNVAPTISLHTWKHVIHGRDGGLPGEDW